MRRDLVLVWEDPAIQSCLLLLVFVFLFLDVRSSFRFSFLDKRIPRYTCPALPYHHLVSSRLDLSSLCYAVLPDKRLYQFYCYGFHVRNGDIIHTISNPMN